MPFNIGDKVRAITVLKFGTCVTVGGVYEVCEPDFNEPDDELFVWVKCDSWSKGNAHRMRVEHVELVPSSPLKKLMNDIASNL